MLARASILIAFASFAAACGAPDSTGQSNDDLRKKKCHSNADCTSLQFCNTESKGSCTAVGVCASRGVNLLCSDIDVPVCGCDGVTYPNGCQAHKAGAAVDHDGACAIVCNTNDDCPSLQYCSKKEGQCGDQGVCASRGVNLFCTFNYQPVCGCDGVTYSNACAAMKGGASLDYDGPCVCDFADTNVDGDTLAEQPWMNQTQSYFYQFTGNGTAVNDSGTVVSVFSPPCLRTMPACRIATRQKTGTFTTSGSTVSITYDDGTSASFDAQTDCHNSWQLLGVDWGANQQLVVSTVNPTP
jgi:hypothetical protein